MIWNQIHIRVPEQGKLWACNMALARRLNPDVDILVIDNASPLDPWQFLSPVGWDRWQLGPMEETIPPMRQFPRPSKTMVRFHESLGHFFYGHSEGKPCRDGPGRAMTLAFRMAHAAGYDRAVYIEADALYRHPVQWGFDRLTRQVGCQPETVYKYLDWHVWWVANLKWFVEDFGFLRRYDWANRKGEQGGEPVAENAYTEILGEHLEVLPVTGVRGETIPLSVDNLLEHLPDNGGDICTHLHMETYALWLKLNGHADLAADLMEGQAPRATPTNPHR